MFACLDPNTPCDSSITLHVESLKIQVSVLITEVCFCVACMRVFMAINICCNNYQIKSKHKLGLLLLQKICLRDCSQPNGGTSEVPPPTSKQTRRASKGTEVGKKATRVTSEMIAVGFFLIRFVSEMIAVAFFLIGFASEVIAVGFLPT